MSNIKTRLHNARSKLLRRGSATSTATRSVASAGSDTAPSKSARPLRKSISLSRLPDALPEGRSADALDDSPIDQRMVKSDILGIAPSAPASPDRRRKSSSHSHAHSRTSTNTSAVPIVRPAVTLEEPTPIHPSVVPPADQLARRVPESSRSLSSGVPTEQSDADHPSPLPTGTTASSTSPVRRQSVVANTDERLIKTLLAPQDPNAAIDTGPPAADYFGQRPHDISAAMLHRKIWVKRPNASATLVQIREDDLVDDVRDMILKKYANSLGRSFDSPDVTIRIVPRDAQKGQDRTLGPEEEMCRTLDAFYPGGQTVNEALLIDVPHRRTPKASPRIPLYYAHHDDATNHQTEYFPPMPVAHPSPSAMSGSHEVRIPLAHAPHSIAVLNTGQLPPLPSPGGTRRGTMHVHRPKYPRHNTASPTILAGGIPSSVTSSRPPNRPRHDSEASEAKNSATSNNPIPTPPALDEPIIRQQTSNPSTPRIASPKPAKERRRRKKTQIEAPSLPAGLLDGSVPPINVLIVEDNIINLRVLGAFMQRLKVRWQRALNGKEAVTKWKAGGFHLVLMDIQLPIMNGLEATKEIRRLERANGIGVFSSGSKEAPHNRLGESGKPEGEIAENDRLGENVLFKSPVIIVALTASSLQSDRHEALAAGCNDFLTKVCWSNLLDTVLY